MRHPVLVLLATILIVSCGVDNNAQTTGNTQTTDLAIDCQFNDTQQKVSCAATGYADGSRLYWWTSSEPAEAGGSKFEFLITNPVPDLTISFEECNNGSCQTVTTSLDSTKDDATKLDRLPKQSKPQAAPPNPSSRITDQANLSAAELVRQWSQGGSATTQCVGSGSSNLSTYPIVLDDVSFVHPLGALNENHVTPTSHTAIVPKIDRVVDIRAPLDGFIVKLANRGSAEAEIQYIIEITCDFYIVLDHVLDPPESILAVINQNAEKSANSRLFTRIPISAGDVLGRHRDGRFFDLTIVDLSLGETKAYIRNESYYSGQTGEPSKLFERDQFDYFDEPLRSQIIDKSLRTVEPRGGSFTYDINGTAQGNWFKKGTRFLHPSWTEVDHLALVFDPVNPSQLRVSIGDGFKGEPKGTQWGVTDNMPAFSEVTAESGPVAFELRKLGRCDSSTPPDPRLPEYYVLCNQDNSGTLLLQLVEDQSLQVEVFFGAPPQGEPEFTANSRIYVR